MKVNIKKMGKAAGAVCVATGVVAISALVASGAAVGAITEGFKSAGSITKKILISQNEEETTVEVQKAPDSPDFEDTTEEENNNNNI